VTDPDLDNWQLCLENCRKSLHANNFHASIAAGPDQARELVLTEILPRLAVRTVSWGDSLTLYSTGLLQALQSREDLYVLDTFDETQSEETLYERRRQALTVDLFLTGSNAVTQTGQLVNLDMIGNRVAGITFGPRHVVIMVGRNKIVPDLEAAMDRVRNLAAPGNAMRFGLRTPCVKTSFCSDCASADRICNNWAITEKSYPRGRIHVVLINCDLGL
jgi:L-lactate utilization protein LutC